MWGVHRWVQNNSYLHALGATHDHCYVTDTIAITVTTDITVVPMICLLSLVTATPLLPLHYTIASLMPRQETNISQRTPRKPKEIQRTQNRNGYVTTSHRSKQAARQGGLMDCQGAQGRASQKEGQEDSVIVHKAL